MTEIITNILPDADSKAARDAERAEIAALRAQLNGQAHPPAVDDTAAAKALPGAPAATEDVKPAPWPYETGDFQGITLQYRQPSDSAMLALGMVTAGGSATTNEGDAQRQVKIINLMLQRHLSVASFDDVQARMCDPENPVTFEDLITFMRTEKE
jgi:hypothetical protein